MSVLGKVYGRIRIERVRKITDKIIGKGQDEVVLDKVSFLRQVLKKHVKRDARCIWHF